MVSSGCKVGEWSDSGWSQAGLVLGLQGQGSQALAGIRGRARFKEAGHFFLCLPHAQVATPPPLPPSPPSSLGVCLHVSSSDQESESLVGNVPFPLHQLRALKTQAIPGSLPQGLGALMWTLEYGE